MENQNIVDEIITKSFDLGDIVEKNYCKEEDVFKQWELVGCLKGILMMRDMIFELIKKGGK